MKTQKNEMKQITDEQKAKRAAYAKKYYEQLKAKKAAEKTDKPAKAKKADKPVKNDAKKAAVKKAAVEKAVVKKVAVKKAAQKVEIKKAAPNKAAPKKADTAKFSMKPAQKLLGQVKKPLGNVRKLVKAYGKLMTETLKTNGNDSANRIAKLFSYAGFEFDPANGCVKISITGKVKAAKAATKPVDAPAKRRGRPPKAAVVDAKPVEVKPDPPAPEAMAPNPKIADINGNVQDILAGEPEDLGDGEDAQELDDTSRDREIFGDGGMRDFGDALAQTEQEMQDNGDWN